MKIALIDPPGTSAGLNTGLAYIAASILARRPEDQVKVFDFNNNRQRVEERMREIGLYDVMAFSLKSFTQKTTFALLDSIPLRKESLIIFGGPHLAIEGAAFLKKDRRIKAALIGEGESSFPKFLDQCEGNENGADADIKGLIRREGEKVISNGDMAIEEDLDQLPFPCYTVFDSIASGLDNYPLLTSRGCPYQCLYCSVGLISGRRWRKRGVGDIIKELKAARERFGFGHFFIIDDNFTLEKDRATQFCQALIASGLDLRWTLPNGIRADRLDEELIKQMKSSGCEAVSFGIESADPEVFKNIGKGETLEEISRAIELCHRYNLRVSGKFIIGLPGATPDSTRRSLHWVREVGLREANWNLLVPYPGTGAYEFIKKNGRFISPWEEGFHFGPFSRSTFELSSYPAKEMERDQRWANVRSFNLLSFYDRGHSLVWNATYLFYLILRYDPGHIFSHLKHLFLRWRLRQRRFNAAAI